MSKPFVLYTMTTYERRQRVLNLLAQKPGIRVSQIADRLGVSQAMVRSDLRALAEGRQQAGVRNPAGPSLDPNCNPAFAARARTNSLAKRVIARWAADLVQDADTILLDASSTVYYMAQCLQNRHDLTIITNGIEVARILSEDPSNTVILLGSHQSDSSVGLAILMRDGLPFVCSDGAQIPHQDCSSVVPALLMRDGSPYRCSDVAQVPHQGNASAVAALLMRDGSPFKCPDVAQGAILHPNGKSIGAVDAERPLAGLRVKTAFVSSEIFSLQGGLADLAPEAAQTQLRMLEGIDSLVALVDSTKFSEVEAGFSFAGADRLCRIFTDSGIDPRWVEPLRLAGVPLTVCDDRKAFAVGPRKEPAARATCYKIGFANLSNENPFALEVRQGLENAVRSLDHVDLVLADNQLSASIALGVADSLITENIDIAIEYQIDQRANDVIMQRFRQAGIPVITVDIPMRGATFFGADNYRAGHMAGVTVGEWIQQNWGGRCDRAILLEEPRAGETAIARLRGQLDGLQSIIGLIPANRVLHLDSGDRGDVAEVRIAQLLPELLDERLAILCMNDDVAAGALQAIRSAGREDQVAVAGQGATRRGRAELRRPGSHFIATTAYQPERYGKQLLALVDRILSHQPVPPAVYVDHVLLTSANVDQYYPND